MPLYDYIIIGAGASGLLLADALGKDDFFKDTSILLLDKEEKKTNDRTWCFWERDEGDFETILHKKWPNIYFGGADLRLSTPIAPYQYKMIKGADFYEYYVKRIKGYPNIECRQEEVIAITEQTVQTKDNTFLGKHIFNSVFDYTNLFKQDKYPVLQQHFLGWFVKTEKAVFNANEATFMDFSIPQKGNTRFMYVLPFSKTEALVEYTLFSEHVLKTEAYEEAIVAYLQDLDCGTYKIKEKEKGNIPMSCFDFAQKNTTSLLHIGIAGGWAKPSTGYTFYNTSKKVRALVAHLKRGKPLNKFHSRNRFWFYDLLLLDILQRDNNLGRSIFESMFKKRKPQLILKFLDEDTSFWEELKVIWACPKWPFLKSLILRLGRF